jgi:hypothetical protein
MRRRRPAADALPAAGALLATVALLAACGGAEAPGGDPGPEAAARRLFELAGVTEPTDAELAGVIGPVPGEEGRAALLDALGALAGATDLVVVEVSRPGGPGDAFVDLEARLAGGGIARFSLRVRASEPAVWRVAWFQGPGVTWPPAGRRQGESLSSSAPPGEAP